MSSNKSSGKKKAILVEAVFDRREGDHLAELSELAFVAGYEVIDRVIQNMDKPNIEYLFGSGKAKEIKGHIKNIGADVIIIENTLDNIQAENLRRMWKVEIVDRFELILEIFINRAGTQEAITQIKLAALKKYGGSRIESQKSIFERHKLIKKLERKLELIKQAKDLRRKRRVESGFDLVAIAGYTNAGKSTLMNIFTEADAEVSGRMFTTLDTKTRSFDYFGRKIMITDTVGFISRLPHVLMDAFYATLKEIKEADLILLLVDSFDSEDNIKRKVLASMNTLLAIEAENIPLIPIMNKIDIAENVDEKAELVETALGIKPIKISAKNQLNIEELQKGIFDILETYRFHIKIPNTNEGMSLISKIHDKTRITNEQYYPNYVEMNFETNARLGLYLYNLLIKSNLAIEIVNKEELEKHTEINSHKKDEDKITILKTDSGEEIVIFDLLEENSKKKKNVNLPDDINNITSIHKEE
ncbi:MAG: HflX GTPase family protein [Candidatus Thorarchaeota archaeon]